MSIKLAQDKAIIGAVTAVSSGDLDNSTYNFYVNGTRLHVQYKDSIGSLHDEIIGVVSETEQSDNIQLSAMDTTVGWPQLRVLNGYARMYTYQWGLATPQFQPNQRLFNLYVPQNSDFSKPYYLDVYWNSNGSSGGVTWAAEGYTAVEGSLPAVTPIQFGSVTTPINVSGNEVKSTMTLDFATAGFSPGEPFYINLYISGSTSTLGTIVNLASVVYRYTLV